MVKANLFFGTSKIFFGHVHYGHLLILGQVEILLYSEKQLNDIQIR